MGSFWLTASAVFLLVCLSTFCAAQKEAGPSFFTAAVFEHRHRHNIETDSVKEVKQKNLENFEKAAEIAAGNGVDIIVFNEYGLFPDFQEREKLTPFMEHVPDPEKRNFNPCEEKNQLQDSLMLVTLSCMAKKHEMYIVANIGDRQPCDSISQTCDMDDMENCEMNDSKCPEDGIFLYNTDVVFNKEGYLIARYHKVHPYFEMLNVPDVPEYSVFSTEFGVFGLIVCFDCMFKESVNLVEYYGVETLLFPTFWFDDISPFNAIELQQAWALANKVNFLAANSHHPARGTLGSGIYSKYFGALRYSYNPDGRSKLLIARVPRNEKTAHIPNNKVNEIVVIGDDEAKIQDDTGESFPEHCYDKIMGNANDNYTDYRCFKQQLEKYSIEKLKGSSGVLKKCHNGMCCSISYSAESMEEDYYLAVFNGTNDVESYYFWCEESCLLVRCDPYEGRPCVTLPSRSRTVFHSIKMRATFTTQKIYPTVSQTRKRLAPKSEWDFKTDENSATLKFESKSRLPVLKVGLVGRCYDRDPPFKTWY